MIIELKNNTNAAALAAAHHAFHILYLGKNYLITGSGVKEVPEALQDHAQNHWVFANDIQLASRRFQDQKRTVNFGKVTIGGQTNNTILIGGPCSVESEEQLRGSAELLVSMGLTTLRGGAYKPRTSPYSFQGMGLEGLQLLAKMRQDYGLNVITEARDATHIEEIIEHTDIIQVGAKAMYDQGILRACAKIKKPVLIKRGFGTTLQEFVQAAEFVLSGGNENVVLCERGILTFETPSHAMGYAYGVNPLARACVAMGINGLLIEAHPNPKVAKSDASQQLNYDEFRKLHADIQKVAQSVGFQIV